MRLANLLGALATGLTGSVNGATSAAAELDEAAATALIALLDFSPRGIRSDPQSGCRPDPLRNRSPRRCLVNAGYVAKRPGRDARLRSPILTASGARVAQRVRIAREGAIARHLGKLSDIERATLTWLCERLVGALTKQRLEQRSAGFTPAGGALCRMCDFGTCGRDQGICPATEAARSRSGGPIDAD